MILIKTCSAADATSHLFFAYLRSLSPTQVRSGISMLPMSLQKLLQETDYPPQVPVLMQSTTYKVVMIVDTVSPTPFALLRRANRFQYRDDDRALQEFSEYQDPVKALTEECHRVLKAISLANESQISSSKHSTSLRDASWSRFEDIGFSGTLEEEDEDDDPVKQIRESQNRGLRTSPASPGNFGRPTTPSWADFLSSGFVNDAPNNPPNLLLPPDKILPPIDTNLRQRSSQSHRPRLEGDVHLEPGELASINQFDLDDAFWWVWMSSLAPEEPAERKAAFGRCAIIETVIRAGRWLVMEEMVKGSAPEPDAGAYIAEKKGLFSWTRRNKGVSRSKSVAGKRNPNDNGARTDGAPGAGASKTSIAPDQQAKIQKAAQQLQAKENQERLIAASLPERRGRTDAEVMREKTNSVMTLQPVIMSEASPAMKWANHYDKQSIRQAYLTNSYAGRGQDQPEVPTNGQTNTNGTATNGNQKPEVPEKAPEKSPAKSPAPVTQTPPVIPQPPATQERAPSPEKRLEAPAEIHPAERPGPTGRNSPLPPPPRENDSVEVPRESIASPEPDVSPDSKKHKKLHKEEKKSGGGFRKFFGRNKNRHSKVPENAASDVNAMLAQEKSQPEPPAEPSASAAERAAPAASDPAVKSPTETPADRLEDATPTQPQTPAAAPKPKYAPSADEGLSRVDTEDAAEANREFLRFDQGPLSDQPAFVPDLESEDDDDDAVPPPIARHMNSSPDAEPRPSEESSAPSPAVPMQDRWATIRKNAADRHARQSEEQSRGGYSRATDDDDNTSGEESKLPPPPPSIRSIATKLTSSSYRVSCSSHKGPRGRVDWQYGG